MQANAYTWNSVDERFWSKVKKGRGCWEWTASKNPRGYGLFRIGKSSLHASRVSVAISKGWGEVEGKDVDHLCRNKSCVRPEHLEAVTHKENILRGEGLAAHNARKTNCLRGHPFTGQNVVVDKRGKRRCRSCERIRWTKAAEHKMEVETLIKYIRLEEGIKID